MIRRQFGYRDLGALVLSGKVGERARIVISEKATRVTVVRDRSVLVTASSTTPPQLEYAADLCVQQLARLFV